jgi:hypothetical protein
VLRRLKKGRDKEQWCDDGKSMAVYVLEKNKTHLFLNCV